MALNYSINQWKIGLRSEEIGLRFEKGPLTVVMGITVYRCL